MAFSVFVLIALLALGMIGVFVVGFMMNKKGR